jgi:L,D-peptidoglycan transpeptidase YkuD (ErfK/YbiS/YcfS/YnhG family)
MHIHIKNKKLFINHYKVKCVVGKRGIGNKKKEGDNITPKGKFKIKSILYRKDRISNFKSEINKLIIQKNMGWCDDPRSKQYNKLIKFPFKFSAEKLYRTDNIYDIILVLNFNCNPVRKNKGSAIFIHIAKRNYNKTAGCIAVSKKDMKKIIKKIKKKNIITIF